MNDCSLCGHIAGELATALHWRVALNLNQDRLGKCMLVLDRHETDVCDLTPEEADSLWDALRRVKAALVACFHPDHFNYMFLMNQDAHVHLHVIPRYYAPRTFAGIEFPMRTALDGGVYHPPDAIYEQIAATIHSQLASAAPRK